MADAGWEALAGVAVGIIGKGLWDWWLATGKVKAEREARAEARRDKLIERRDDLQRQTLLELQPVILAMARAYAKGLFHDLKAFREQDARTWGASQWPGDVAEEARVAQAQVTLLRSRVRDDALRELIVRFSKAYTAAAMAKDEGASAQQENQAAHMLTELQDRIGQTIREMDDPSRTAI